MTFWTYKQKSAISTLQLHYASCDELRGLKQIALYSIGSQLSKKVQFMDIDVVSWYKKHPIQILINFWKHNTYAAI